MRPTLLVVVLLLLAGCVGSSEPPAPAEPSSVGYEVEWRLAVRGTEELNFAMEQGATVSYDINATSAVEWDLHSHHEDGSVNTWGTGTDRRVNGTFQAPASDTYSLFVKATGQATGVRVALRGAFAVEE